MCNEVFPGDINNVFISCNVVPLLGAQDYLWAKSKALREA